jgi:hypothetical protein
MKHGDLPKPKAEHEDSVWSLACSSHPWLSCYQLVIWRFFMCSLIGGTIRANPRYSLKQLVLTVYIYRHNLFIPHPTMAIVGVLLLGWLLIPGEQ